MSDGSGYDMTRVPVGSRVTGTRLSKFPVVLYTTTGASIAAWLGGAGVILFEVLSGVIAGMASRWEPHETVNTEMAANAARLRLNFIMSFVRFYSRKYTRFTRSEIDVSIS